MLRSISLNRRRSSNSSVASGTDTPTPGSTRTTADLAPGSARSTSDLKASFLRPWRRSDVVELAAVKQPASNPSADAVPSPLDELRDAGREMALQQQQQLARRDSGASSDGGTVRGILKRTTSDVGRRSSATGAGTTGAGEVVSDEVAGVIGSYGRQQ